MELVKEIKTIDEIPKDFDFLIINDSQPITLYLDEWVGISLLIDDEHELFDFLKVEINKATVQAYNRYARLCNYAKEMIDRGLWPDHSQKR